MKPSTYNFFLPYEADNSKLIAYNSFSNALALMDKDKYEIFRKFCENDVHIDDDEFIDQLKSGRFLVDDNCDELGLLRLRMLKGRYNTDYLNLTIAPTADCNFRCVYCYEKDVIKPDYMSEGTEDAIIKLVENQIKTISVLKILWYGGEPLMSLETVERLSKRFIHLCDEHDVVYGASIITNGYMFTRQVCELLNTLKITSVQITIDGKKEVHDCMRPLADGSGTFDTILSNLEECSDILPRTSIRINVDKNNANDSYDVVNALRERKLLNKVTPYLGMITSEASESEKHCFDACSFSEVDFDFVNRVASDGGTISNIYPSEKANFCTADSTNGYVIAADGSLYSCFKDIGNIDRSIGNIARGELNTEDVYLDYMLQDPTTDDNCKKCGVLPICMGGCPYQKLVDRKNTCSKYNILLEKYLGTFAEKAKATKVGVS